MLQSKSIISPCGLKANEQQSTTKEDLQSVSCPKAQWIYTLGSIDWITSEKDDVQKSRKISITITTISSILSLGIQRNSVLILHAHCVKTIVKKINQNTHRHTETCKHTDPELIFGDSVFHASYVNSVKYHDGKALLRSIWCDKIENLYTRKTIISAVTLSTTNQQTEIKYQQTTAN